MSGHDLFGRPIPDLPDRHEPPDPVGWIEAVRDRRRLVRPAGRWVGIGRERPTQPDLFEATFRVGFWFWDICPHEIESGLVEQIAFLKRTLRETTARLRGRAGQ